MHWSYPLWLIQNYLVLQGCSLIYWLNPKTRDATIAVALYWFWAVFLILENPSSVAHTLSVGLLIVIVWLVDRGIDRHTPAWLHWLKTQAGGFKERPADSDR
jgi:hypothetical protein